MESLEAPRREPYMTEGLQRYRFNVDEYYAMAKVGIFDEDSMVELGEGDITVIERISPRQAGINMYLNDFFLSARLNAVVSARNPVRLNRYSEPCPDIALLKFKRDYYSSAHPTGEDVLLLIEVAEATPVVDRLVKGLLYARAGVQEFWLVDLEANALEVYRSPSTEGYREVRRLGRDASVSPSAFPDISIAIAEVLG